MSTDGATWAIVSGGGTAGHLLPGITVADELVRRGRSAESIHFVGAARGIEADLVPAAGYSITLLPGRGVQRKLSLQNIGAVWGLIRAFFAAFALVRRRRPKVVLVLGGFASAAVAMSAVIWRVPLVVAEQNARAGAVNRIVGRFARYCAVPFASTDLPHAMVTGNPVRSEVLDAAASPDRAAARGELDLPAERTVIVVFAGSLGARRINTAVVEAARRWADRDDLCIHHVIGARDWDARVDPFGPESDHSIDYRAVRYEDRMPLVLSAADVAVCRAGGTTVAELAVVGVPAVLVPLPIATRDHQRHNATELVEAGGAVLIDDASLDADRLVAELGAILDRPGRLAAMADAAASLGRTDAADAVADLVESAADGGRASR